MLKFVPPIRSKSFPIRRQGAGILFAKMTRGDYRDFTGMDGNLISCISSRYHRGMPGMVDIISFALGGITVEAWWVKCVGKGKSQVQSPQMRIA